MEEEAGDRMAVGGNEANENGTGSWMGLNTRRGNGNCCGVITVGESK